MKMHARSAVNVLIILVTSWKVGARRVNLESEARGYITKLRTEGHKIVGWGLTADYQYWTIMPHKEEYPITGRVEKLECDFKTASTDRDTVLGNKCVKEMTWKIQHGIDSPFTLNATVEVPMLEKSARKRNITFDVNNQTKIVLRSTRPSGNSNSVYVRKIIKTCHFAARTFLDGWFAYELQARGDNFKYGTVGVGELQNTAAKLMKLRTQTLAYNVTGTYTEISCRRIHDRPKGREY